MVQQRTCNIIMACKGHCEPAKNAETLMDCVKIYLGHECDYPWENYSNKMIESVLREALYDFMTDATNPGHELRQLLCDYPTKEPSLSERICTMFQLTQVKNNDGYMNGFTQELIDQSRQDLHW